MTVNRHIILFYLGIVFLLIAACREQQPEPTPKTPIMEASRKTSLAWPETGAYTGAYIDFGFGEDDVTLEAILNFDQLSGKQQAIIALGSFWGEQHFPAEICRLLDRYGAVPLLFWSPWDRPYEENKGIEKKFTLSSILEGKWDSYIDSWAEGAKQFGRPMLAAFGLEMNGIWFPWGGFHYGGGNIVGNMAGKPVYEGPDTFKKAYRYVVERVRQKGAKNILWGFHVNHTTYPNEAWNRIAQYYPGSDVVDWMGFSVYGQLFSSQGWWSSFQGVFDDSYREMEAIDPIKPMVLAEWGVGEFPRSGDKAVWIAQAFDSIKNRYPRIKAAVYWHERWQNEDGTYSNLRINSSQNALKAYKTGISDDYWISRPIYKNISN